MTEDLAHDQMESYGQTVEWPDRIALVSHRLVFERRSQTGFWSYVVEHHHDRAKLEDRKARLEKRDDIRSISLQSAFWKDVES